MYNYYIVESKQFGILGAVYSEVLSTLNTKECAIAIFRCLRSEDDEIKIKVLSEIEFDALNVSDIINNKNPIKKITVEYLLTKYICLLDEKQKEELWMNDDSSWGPRPKGVDSRIVEKSIKQLIRLDLTEEEFVSIRDKAQESVDKLINETIPQILKKRNNKKR